MTETSPVSF